MPAATPLMGCCIIQGFKILDDPKEQQCEPSSSCIPSSFLKPGMTRGSGVDPVALHSVDGLAFVLLFNRRKEGRKSAGSAVLSSAGAPHTVCTSAHSKLA